MLRIVAHRNFQCKSVVADRNFVGIAPPFGVHTMHDMTDETGPRLKQARLNAGFRTAAEFADKNGIPRPTYQLHEQGRRRLKPEVAAQYSRILGIQVEWLLYGNGNSPDISSSNTISDRLHTQSRYKTIMIDELDVRAGAGGWQSGEWGEPVSAWQLPSELVRLITSTESERIKIIRVVGDSMTPAYSPGDRIMVDTEDRRPSPPGVFVLYDGLGLVVKRVEFVPFSDPGKVRIFSVNPEYSPYERTLEEAYIQGRVVGKWLWT